MLRTNLMKSNSMGLAVGLILGFASALGGADAAWSSTTLKKVQVTDGSQIDLFFDGKVSPSQIRTEYFNDIIQLSLEDVSVYPAKISSYSGMELTKIFAYQYAPKLVRCRLSVKGKAEDYQKRVEVKANGKVLSVRIKPAEPVAKAAEKTAEEAALLARVLKSETTDAAAKDNAAADSAKESEAAPLKKDKSGKNTKSAKGASGEDPELRPLTSGKPLPSPFRSMMMLGLVMAVFGGFAFLLKKVKNGPSLINHKGFAGAIGKFAKGSLGRKGKMIEVVATHYLGPKKSIAMVRVGGRILVLGVTNESINLITQLSSEMNGDDLDLEKLAFGEGGGLDASDPLTQAFFSQPKAQQKAAPAPASSIASQMAQSAYSGAMAGAHSSAAVAKTQAPKPSSNEFSEILNRENSKPSVRAQIRSRLEGMKQL